MNDTTKYTVSIYSENTIGMLNRISGIFQRRHINVESINSSVSEIDNVSKWAIVVKTSEVQIKKIIGQIEKQVEVIRAYYHTDDEIFYQESSMIKLKTDLVFDNKVIQDKILVENLRIVNVNKEFMVLKKSGSSSEISKVYNFFRPFGIMQFVRSARIIISKEPMEISSLLIGSEE